MVNSRQSNKRNHWLDVLRGLAIFGVVSTHSINLTDNIGLTNTSAFFSLIANLGRYGVEVFFFLSGWLLVSIYGFNGVALGKSFLIKRMAKIYPLWIFFLLLSLVRWQFTDSGKINSPISSVNGDHLLHSTAGIILLSLTFTLFISNSLWNGVIFGGWSIQAEVAHYFIFALIRNRSINSILKISALVNFATVLMIVLRVNLNSLPLLLLQMLDAWIRLGIYSTFGYFLMGILSYLYYIKIKESRISSLKFKDLGISPNIFTTYCISFLAVPCYGGNQVEAIGYLGITILASFVILQNKQLSSFFKFLGRYSYFIYFAHFIALMAISWAINRVSFIKPESSSQQVIFLFIFVLSLTISSLLAIPSMRYFEAPIIRMAHKV